MKVRKEITKTKSTLYGSNNILLTYGMISLFWNLVHLSVTYNCVIMTCDSIMWHVAVCNIMLDSNSKFKIKINEKWK